MYDVIHLDAKWFYMTRSSQRIYLSPNEPAPLRRCKSKRFIGKLDIWSFVERTFAQRTNKSRLVGNVELKPVTAVKRAEYVDMLLENVIPAITAKFPRRSQRGAIYLQQDKARPYVKEDDPLVSEAGRQLRLKLRAMCQPPNSPEFNVLELGYFRSIQTLQH
ncbi:unnamed protein product [Hyaloperonospora brassicae]|uniref:Transposase n=1 Tax=Hyaloperonospora brassicae TaxID=162125 RepID=A0AAV0T190_HYABA|nr:unnamed protein product [Hyaloperonospora brassicae]